MRALTIRQPWASLIALGRKTVEVRSWRTDYRGPLAIHAAARPEPTYARDFARNPLPLSAFVALVTLQECRPLTADDAEAGCFDHEKFAAAWSWYSADEDALSERRIWAWVLADPRRPAFGRRPAPAVGKRGLWTPPPAVAEEIRRYVRGPLSALARS